MTYMNALRWPPLCKKMFLTITFETKALGTKILMSRSMFLRSRKLHRPRHQNLHPKYFSSKVIVKDIFLHNGGQRNAFAYVTRSNRPRYFLIY